MKSNKCKINIMLLILSEGIKWSQLSDSDNDGEENENPYGLGYNNHRSDSDEDDNMQQKV